MSNNKSLAKAEAAYNAWKEGKSVRGRDGKPIVANEDAVIGAIQRNELRWGIGPNGGFIPLAPGDSGYDKGYASPREALHFVKGDEPTRTPQGQIAGAAFAPISQHRLEGDKIRSEQKSAVADVGQDVARGATKFALPLAIAFGMRDPMRAAKAAAGVSGLGSLANTGVSKLRNDPYGDSFGQGVATALATGLGTLLGRSMTTTRQAGRWAEKNAADRLRTLGLSSEEADALAAESRNRLTHGLPELTYGDYRYAPLREFDERTGAQDIEVKMEPHAYPIEGYYDKNGNFIGSKILPRKPVAKVTTTTSKSVKNKVPNKAGQSVQTETTVTETPDKTVTTDAGKITTNGRTTANKTTTTKTTKLPVITDDIARNWLMRNHYPVTEPGAIEQAKRLLDKGWLNPQSELGLTFFGTRGNELRLPKKDLTAHIVDPAASDLERKMYKERAFFEDPVLDKEWKAARDEFGRRSALTKRHSGMGDKTPILSRNEYLTKKNKGTTKFKSVGSAIAGFALPIATELLYDPIRRKLTNE